MPATPVVLTNWIMTKLNQLSGQMNILNFEISAYWILYVITAPICRQNSLTQRVNSLQLNRHTLKLGWFRPLLALKSLTTD